MRKLLFNLIAVAFAVGLAAPMAQACGDKFLVSSQNLTQAQMNSHAGVILLYRNPQSSIAQAVFDTNLKKSLEHRGHTVEVVESAQDLEQHLSDGKVDLVMMAEDDAQVLGSAREHARVMPVTQAGADWLHIKSLRDVYGFALDGGAKTSKKTQAIDEAMKKAK